MADQAGAARGSAPHAGEAHVSGLASRLNWLRAGVLGANDGIVSVAAVVVGVASATSELSPIVIAGVAAVVGGAISMGLGEYVSVSSQRDTQRALIAKERAELESLPDEELEELIGLYEGKGLSRETAALVASELTSHDALTAHLEAELGINEADVVSPWQAAAASALAFFIGAALPMLAILLPPADLRVPITFVAVLIALTLTGVISSRLGESHWPRPTLRIVLGGELALAVTFLIGTLLDTSGVV